MGHNHARFVVPFLARLPLIGAGLVGLLCAVACSPPDQTNLDVCRKTVAASTGGRGLTPNDIGELVEDCMTKQGYRLKKTGTTCSHDLRSQENRRCYYPDNFAGRIVAGLPEF